MQAKDMVIWKVVADNNLKSQYLNTDAVVHSKWKW